MRVLDGAGRIVALIDALGNATRYSYDSLNQLTQIVDALQGATTFSYDMTLTEIC